MDAHRSLGVVVSKYSPRAADGGAFVDSRFYSTVSMVRTMEAVLGLPPMNNNDAFASMMGSLFTGAGIRRRCGGCVEPEQRADLRGEQEDGGGGGGFGEDGLSPCGPCGCA